MAVQSPTKQLYTTRLRVTIKRAIRRARSNVIRLYSEQAEKPQSNCFEFETVNEAEQNKYNEELENYLMSVK